MKKRYESLGLISISFMLLVCGCMGPENDASNGDGNSHLIYDVVHITVNAISTVYDGNDGPSEVIRPNPDADVRIVITNQGKIELDEVYKTDSEGIATGIASLHLFANDTVVITASMASRPDVFLTETFSSQELLANSTRSGDRFLFQVKITLPTF